MGAALRAEWAKTRTAPGTFWLLIATVATMPTLGVLAAGTVRCPAGGCPIDPAQTSLTGIYLGQAVVVILAVLAIGTEYRTGMIRLTFTAMPRRTTVLAAKAFVLAVLVLVAGTTAVLSSLLAGRAVLAAHGISPAHGYPSLSLGDGPVLRAAAGSVLYLALIAVLSLGVATTVRDPATAIGIVLGLLYLAPILSAAVGGAQWQRHIQQIAPMPAGLAIQATTGLRNLPISPWAGLGVLAGWTATAFLAGTLRVRAPDA
jgi:ABC-2 type transport system permease protein